MTLLETPATVARLTGLQTETRTRLAVIADPHVSPRAEGTPMVYHRSAERLRTALEDATCRGVDAVLSAGDLTKDGAPWEYDLLDDILSEFECRFVSVPGNHDVPKAPVEEYEYGDEHETPPVTEFEQKYAPNPYPFIERVGGVDILALNTASQANGSLQHTHDGKVAKDDLAWLETALAESETPLVLMHHNTPAMYEQFDAHRELGHPEMDLPPVMRDPDPLMDVLRAENAPLVLTGHLHNVGVAQTGSTWEVTTPATGSFPQGYFLVDVGPAGTVVRYVPVTDVEGMTEAHVARASAGATSTGFTSFAAARLASLPLVDEFGPDATAD